MPERIARCSECGSIQFYIFEDRIHCVGCGGEFAFEFMDDAKSLCTTKADDIVRLIEGD